VELNDENLSYCSRKYRLSVRLLANDLAAKLREYKRKYTFPFHEKVVRKVSQANERPPLHLLMNPTDWLRDIVLDYGAIRNLGIAELIGRSPEDFRLPGRA
jgi:hypothetical protein